MGSFLLIIFTDYDEGVTAEEAKKVLSTPSPTVKPIFICSS
jgi:hypothetical protein